MVHLRTESTSLKNALEDCDFDTNMKLTKSTSHVSFVMKALDASPFLVKVESFPGENEKAENVEKKRKGKKAITNYSREKSQKYAQLVKKKRGYLPSEGYWMRLERPPVDTICEGLLMASSRHSSPRHLHWISKSGEVGCLSRGQLEAEIKRYL